MKKQQEITDQTRQNLVEAFWSLYTTRRIDRITVREITTKAGYNRGTFYEYFRDVYDVLEYIENQSLPTIAELPPWKEGSDRNTGFIEPIMELYRGKLKYYHVLLGDQGDPAFQRKLKNNLKSSIHVVLSKHRDVDPVELDLMLEYTLSGLIGLLIYAKEAYAAMPEDQMISTIYGLFQSDMLRQLRDWMA